MRRLSVLLGVIAASLSVTPARAAAPNDDRANASPITRLPFTGGEATADATFEADEPRDCQEPASLGRSDPSYYESSIWYRFDPSRDLTIGIAAQVYDSIGISAISASLLETTGIAVWTEAPSGVLGLIACQRHATGAYPDISAPLGAGTSYLVQVICSCSAPSTYFQVQMVEIPANDDIDDATPIEAVPFEVDLTLGYASFEANEATGCSGGSNAASDLLLGAPRTAWYRYEAPVDDVLHVLSDRMFNGIDVGVFERVGPELRLISCATWDSEWDPGDRNVSILSAQAGHEYLFQLIQRDVDPWMTEFTVIRAPQRDYAVQSIEVADNGAFTLEERAVDVAIAASAHSRGSRPWIAPFKFELTVCPLSTPDQCSVVDSRTSTHRLGEGAGDAYAETWRFVWNPRGCVGDVVIKARFIPWYDVDPDLSNNEASTTVSLVAGGHGIGLGSCGRELVQL